MKSLYLSIVVIALIVGCSQPTEEVKTTKRSWNTVSLLDGVKRSAAPSYSREEYDPQSFLDQTRPDKRDLWFKFPDDEHWYIDWDAERQPFDLIVIHHSATSPDVTAESISESQKTRLYAPRYKSGNNDPYVKGLPPHSGHVINDGEETFIGYHHLVYPDGMVTTELSPLVKINGQWFVDMVGWHSGDWDVNCRSIGICLVGDFTDEKPPEKQLSLAATLIAHYKDYNPDLDVQPHKAFSATECPGNTWPSWRNKIMKE